MGGNIRRQLRPIVSFNTSMQHSDMINCSQCYLCKRCCRAFFTTVVQQTDVDDRWENDAERPAATGLQLCSYQGFVIQIASDAIITRYKDNIHSSCWLGRHETSVPSDCRPSYLVQNFEGGEVFHLVCVGLRLHVASSFSVDTFMPTTHTNTQPSLSLSIARNVL